MGSQYLALEAATESLADAVGHLLHLGVVHVLAQVAADEHQHPGVLYVHRLGRADDRAEGQIESHLTRPATLRVGRRGYVGRAIGIGQVLEPRAPIAMIEQGQGLGSVLLLHLEELPGSRIGSRIESWEVRRRIRGGKRG